jgi:hypothetical protein
MNQIQPSQSDLATGPLPPTTQPMCLPHAELDREQRHRAPGSLWHELSAAILP